MGMLGKSLWGGDLHCKNCGQKSSPKPGRGHWEPLGKSQGRAVMACLKCGHGVALGIFSERHLDADFISSMRGSRDAFLDRMMADREKTELGSEAEAMPSEAEIHSENPRFQRYFVDYALGAAEGLRPYVEQVPAGVWTDVADAIGCALKIADHAFVTGMFVEQERIPILENHLSSLTDVEARSLIDLAVVAVLQNRTVALAETGFEPDRDACTQLMAQVLSTDQATLSGWWERNDERTAGGKTKAGFDLYQDWCARLGIEYKTPKALAPMTIFRIYFEQIIAAEAGDTDE
jgi:hypothetical protein